MQKKLYNDPLNFKSKFLEYEKINSQLMTYPPSTAISPITHKQINFNSNLVSYTAQSTHCPSNLISSFEYPNRLASLTFKNNESIAQFKSPQRPSLAHNITSKYSTIQFPISPLNTRISLLFKKKKNLIKIKREAEDFATMKLSQKKDAELLVRLAADFSERKTNNDIVRNESVGNCFKDFANSPDQKIPAETRYHVNEMKRELKDIRIKVKLMKGICDYTCPLIFVAKTEINIMKKIKEREKEIQSRNKKKKNRKVRLYDRNNKLTNFFLTKNTNDYIKTSTLYNTKKTYFDIQKELLPMNQ